MRLGNQIPGSPGVLSELVPISGKATCSKQVAGDASQDTANRLTHGDFR